MEVIGLRPKENGFIVLATEEELGRITGIDNVVPIEGRILVGTKIEVSALWDRLKVLNSKQKELTDMANDLRTKADEIDTAFSGKVKEIISEKPTE